jgi:ABC-type nitrate/sulfonate/bicarbonate transport system ATPase subunit
LLDVAALPGNSYVRSARSAGYDVLEQALNVQYNTAALVEIELAVDGGQIAGIVADGGESTVVLIPDASRRHRPDQYRIAKSTAEGRFSINGVPPGDYRLFAWRSVETNAWLNSEFMLTNEQFGTNISVSPNSRASVQVRSIARSQ